MPTSAASHDSHLSVPDSLSSLSDHGSLSSAASTYSSLSSQSAAAQSTIPPDTRTSHELHTKMSGDVALTRNTAPQRSATIKATNQSASTSRASTPASIVPLHNTVEPSIVNASDVSLAALTPPVLQRLTFADDNAKSATFSRSSQQALAHAYLALDGAEPRLSTSSNESGSSNELATPENQHQSWSYDAHNDSALAALQASSSASSSSYASSYERTRPIHIQTTEPGADLRPPSREVDASSAQLDRLALQRPAKLERLSSAATNATARASTFSDESSPHTATQSPRHLQAPDLSSLRFASGSVQCMPASAPAASSVEHFNRSPSLDTDIPSRTNMTSPDSWRSLLPEHDPYFASGGQLRTSQHQRSASPQNLHPATSAFDIETYAAAKASPRAAVHDRMSTSSFDTARTSFSSAISGYSAMSLAGLSKSSMQSQDSAKSDSWRSLLPDDDRFHASRDPNATSSVQQGFDASPLLTSPSLSDRLDSPISSDGHNHRSAFFALDAPRSSTAVTINDADSAARRHSSFSSIEPKNSKQFAATRVMLASMRDTAGPSGSIKSASGKFAPSILPCASSSSADAASPRGEGSLEASNMTPELSQSSATEDDLRERDSWPTSRSGRRGADSPVSSGPLTPETGLTPGSKSSLAGVLSQESDSEARVDSPSLVSETSESVVEATQDGLLATTTTTTTKTFTTTRTQLLPDAAATAAAAATRPLKARSEAGATAEDGDEMEALQSHPMKTRTSSCSISTPISPPSLPFLERRPAPPETDLVIETERTRYVLVTRLPGFSLDCITLATKQHKHHRTLHIVADKWDTEGGGHFERRITFPDKECDLKNVKAEFDGNTLRVYVPRKVAANRFSSASSATF
ncbi:hypothetical protein EX895_001917 [Sporisorium graminicola]|uniref:SHSP domain-containing protein n=1 Tax=Sporisorium graminicola TaxID=280036 RepID=A0A4U7KYG3_9BASI|nr:hypothetical protein EX895_001917 [Sporisorium graminicola]TKY89386.1 hypothetical protein EX895_001917 [Sporisorium graminicola]